MAVFAVGEHAAGHVGRPAVGQGLGPGPEDEVDQHRDPREGRREPAAHLPHQPAVYVLLTNTEHWHIGVGRGVVHT